MAQTIVDKIKALYFGESQIEKEEKRVTGIGGFFFKAENPTELKNWYKKHLGLNTDDYGCTFWWKNNKGEDCSTQWAPFKDDTNYFEPSEKQFMQNFRVENLEQLVQDLASENVQILGEMQVFDYGKFAAILDLEGNKIELWEPIDAVFK